MAEDADGLRSRFLALLRDEGDADGGVKDAVIKAAFSEDEFQRIVHIINDLLADNLVTVYEDADHRGTTYKLRDEKEAEKISELTNEQILVLQVVERADANGVWLRDIKSATSMTQQALSKALKVLESRKLVKTVRSVQQKTKKLYMLYDKIPTREVSGGPWYTDQEFDHEFVKALKRFVVQIVEKAKQITMSEVETIVNKSGVSTVPLNKSDLQLVVDALVADSQLEPLHFQNDETQYKKARSGVDVAWVSEVPGGSCAWPRGAGDGAHAPESCQYVTQWLALEEGEGGEER